VPILHDQPMVRDFLRELQMGKPPPLKYGFIPWVIDIDHGIEFDLNLSADTALSLNSTVNSCTLLYLKVSICSHSLIMFPCFYTSCYYMIIVNQWEHFSLSRGWATIQPSRHDGFLEYRSVKLIPIYLWCVVIQI